MTVGDVMDLQAHWCRCPPAHLAIDRLTRLQAASKGIELRDEAPRHTDKVERVDEGAVRALCGSMNKSRVG